MFRIKAKIKKPLFKRKCDNYVRKLKKKKHINYLRSELRSSTTHGLPYIVNVDIHWFERLFWATNFLACSALVFLLLSAQYYRFIETPIVMSMEMDYFNWNVSYPAFTLCPMFKPGSDFNILVNETNENAGANIESYLWSIIASNMETLEILDLQSSDVLPLINPKDYTRLAATAFRKFEMESITTNNDWPISVEPVMTELGMCHVVNSNVAVFDNPDNWNNSRVAYAKNNIQLSVHDKDFFTQLVNYADVYKVYIHSPDEIILSTTPSYTHSVKGYISFGVQIWSSKISDELRYTGIRLRKCRFINEPISKRYPVYSYSHCMLECKIKMIVSLCGCVPHFYKPLGHERICNLGELRCVIRYKKEIISLSASESTTTKHEHAGLPKFSRDCGCISSCESDVYQAEEDFIPQPPTNRLRIGISSYPKIRVVRDMIFSFYDIFLRSGGVVNLCTGASIISMVEFILILMRTLVFVLTYILGI